MSLKKLTFYKIYLYEFKRHSFKLQSDDFLKSVIVKLVNKVPSETNDEVYSLLLLLVGSDCVWVKDKPKKVSKKSFLVPM